MPNLRYLQADCVNFQGTFPCFPTDLKWLKLLRCHFDSPPSDFNLEKLVILDLVFTNIAPIFRLKAFERLKVLSLVVVETKITLDFTGVYRYYRIQFGDWVHLRSLIFLVVGKFPLCQSDLKSWDHSRSLISVVPDSICHLSYLEMLVLVDTELRSIPEGLGDMESLKKIYLSGTCIEVIPDSIGRLTNLDKLSLCNSESLRELPDSICQLKMLKSLDLKGCVSLRSLPERLGEMEKLEELILDSTRIEAIPDSVGRLENLRLLSLKGCKFIKALPISIRQLSFIQWLEMSGTNLNVAEIDLPAINFIEFTGSSSELLGLCDQTHKALEILHLKDATIEDLPDCVGRMEKLKELRLECEMLKEFPNWIEGSLENLTQLEVMSMHLKALPDCIGQLKQLGELSLKCENLKALPNSIGSLKHMWKLELNCMNLESLPDSIGELENVAFFEIQSAKLKALPSSIALLGSVENLVLHCMSLEALPDSIGHLKKLTDFRVSSNSLEVLPDSIGRLKKLTYFEVSSNSLEALPDSIGSLKHVQTLTLKCPNLEALPDSIGELEDLDYFEVVSHRLKYLPNSMERLHSLQMLHLHCDNFTSLPDFIGRLENLESFSFNSKKLKYLDAAIFESLGRLSDLDLSGCEDLEGMLAASIGQTDFARFSSLESLYLNDCKGLEYLPQLPSSLRSLYASGCTNLREMWDISNLKTLENLRLGGCKQLEDVPGLEIISCNLERLGLPGPCDFMGCCHFSHDFKNKVFKEMTFDNLRWFQMSGSLVQGSAKGQQQLQFMLPRLPSSWLRRARLELCLDEVLSPICIAIIADDVTVFEKIGEVDGNVVELKLGEESIVNIGEGAHCYTMQVTMEVSQLKEVNVFLENGRWLEVSTEMDGVCT